MADTNLASAIFLRILKKYGDDIDPSNLPKAQQTVLLIWHSFGILGNGGFQYLFEGDIPGDPEYLLTRQAYKTIGATEALVAFNKAFAVFPKAIPPADIDHRLELWQSQDSIRGSWNDKNSPDRLFFKAMDGVEEKLNDYIKAHWSEFDSLPNG